jgi:hypothetical protein
MSCWNWQEQIARLLVERLGIPAETVHVIPCVIIGDVEGTVHLSSVLKHSIYLKRRALEACACQRICVVHWKPCGNAVEVRISGTDLKGPE